MQLATVRINQPTLLTPASICFILETQANYITQLIEGIKKENIKALDVSPAATTKWYDAVSKRAEKTVWSKAKSYMRNRGGDGKVWTHYPGFVGEIWWTNRTPEWSDYTGAEALARRQVARRWITRLVFLAALVVGLRYVLPVPWLANVYNVANSAAATTGVPATWVESVAGVLDNAASHIDTVVGGIKSFIK